MGKHVVYDSPKLGRKGAAGRYRGFPIRREEKDEYHVYMGFDNQAQAEKWIDEGIANGLLSDLSLKQGPPKKP